MKVIFIALCMVAGAFGRSMVQSQQPLAIAEGPQSPIDDPLLRDGPLPLNITVNPMLMIALGSELKDVKVEGLSTFHYKVEIRHLLRTATFEVTITKVTGNATYDVEGYLDARPLRPETLPSGNMTGNGFGTVSATNVHLKGSATLFTTIEEQKVGINVLTIETISFDSLALDFGQEFTIGGIKPIWEDLNNNIKKNFEEDWANKKHIITERLRYAANGILGKYTLLELVCLIDGGQGGNPFC